MELKGKMSIFRTMIEKASLKGTFADLPMEIHTDKFVLIQCQDGAGKVAATIRGIFTGFDKIDAGDKKEMVAIGIKVSKVLSFLKYFAEDDIVTMTSDKGDLIIAGGQYVFTTAIIDPESIKIYTKKLEFMIDETKKVALYKKGSIQPTTIATLKADVLKTISKLSSEIGQEYYPIQVDPPDKVSCNVGSRKKDRTNDVAGYTSKTGDVMVEGESMYTTLGHGFKEVCSVIDGDVLISGVNEKVFSKMAPLWIYYHGDNFEIGFYLAPRMAE
jgi:hypothetical protein